mmetsp:Transcript_12438/g.23389  ORF Transcript_12438/g.23389 Transcript_12438/m.23389 type:complete len:110 (-) Transcript_12438:217-546(-)|eukprot:CAMPEP_0197443232 /NCGR_PEP_ID=MMETSP1175-20131217/9022_1 /TAXON_ID=1003142 /ORGANISM="Triceratium dubium, Strain CCMP147" /LENGTH=109 /DNA_ID=CAMNT_0042973833 /DNA_START=141 /DNA_END=470 /DNA_ORIENTATION=+
MKLLSSVSMIVFGLLGSAAAFSSPSVFGISRVTSRPTTTKTFQTDQGMINHLEQNGEDVVRAVLLECDQEECTMVDATHDSEGWHFENGLPAGKETRSEILMLDIDDTE